MGFHKSCSMEYYKHVFRMYHIYVPVSHMDYCISYSTVFHKCRFPVCHNRNNHHIYWYFHNRNMDYNFDKSIFRMVNSAGRSGKYCNRKDNRFDNLN